MATDVSAPRRLRLSRLRRDRSSRESSRSGFSRSRTLGELDRGGRPQAPPLRHEELDRKEIRPHRPLPGLGRSASWSGAGGRKGRPYGLETARSGRWPLKIDYRVSAFASGETPGANGGGSLSRNSESSFLASAARRCPVAS